MERQQEVIGSKTNRAMYLALLKCRGRSMIQLWPEYITKWPIYIEGIGKCTTKCVRIHKTNINAEYDKATDDKDERY